MRAIYAVACAHTLSRRKIISGHEGQCCAVASHGQLAPLPFASSFSSWRERTRTSAAGVSRAVISSQILDTASKEPETRHKCMGLMVRRSRDDAIEPKKSETRRRKRRGGEVALKRAKALAMSSEVASVCALCAPVEIPPTIQASRCRCWCTEKERDRKGMRRSAQQRGQSIVIANLPVPPLPLPPSSHIYSHPSPLHPSPIHTHSVCVNHLQKRLRPRHEDRRSQHCE